MFLFLTNWRVLIAGAIIGEVAPAQVIGIEQVLPTSSSWAPIVYGQNVWQLAPPIILYGCVVAANNVATPGPLSCRDGAGWWWGVGWHHFWATNRPPPGMIMSGGGSPDPPLG
jgi:hypothetical protein